MTDLTYPLGLPFTPREQEALDHIYSPEVGDYWHECFAPYMVVVAVFAKHVIVCPRTKEAGPNFRWTWDLDQLQMLTRAEFRQELNYHTPSLQGMSTHSVEPRAHVWVASEL